MYSTYKPKSSPCLFHHILQNGLFLCFYPIQVSCVLLLLKQSPPPLCILSTNNSTIFVSISLEFVFSSSFQFHTFSPSFSFVSAVIHPNPKRNGDCCFHTRYCSWYNTRVMSSNNTDVFHFALFPIPIVCCSCDIDGVGLNATRTTKGIPLEIPPRLPP